MRHYIKYAPCMIFFSITGIRDNSGLRIHMTPTLREHDIGIMSLGVVVDEGMIIPPHFESLRYRGHCRSDCLQQVRRTLLAFSVLHWK